MRCGAGMLRESAGATCESSAADAGPCNAQAKFAERVREVSLHLSLSCASCGLGALLKASIWGRGEGLQEIAALRYLTKVEKDTSGGASSYS